MQTILVTGGTGYIGAHTIVDLIENGFEIIDYRRFRYIQENGIIVTFIEYTLEINVKKDNKI